MTRASGSGSRVVPRARLARPGARAVELAWSNEDEAFRRDLLAFLEAHCPPEARVERDFIEMEGDNLPDWARRWQATLFDHGWMIPAYPPELGGRNASPVQTLIYLEELARQG